MQCVCELDQININTATLLPYSQQAMHLTHVDRLSPPNSSSWKPLSLCKSLNPVQQWCQTYGPQSGPLNGFWKVGILKQTKKKKSELSAMFLSVHWERSPKKSVENPFPREMITDQVSWILHAGVASWKCRCLELWNLKGGKWIQSVSFSENNEPFSIFSRR